MNKKSAKKDMERNLRPASQKTEDRILFYICNIDNFGSTESAYAPCHRLYDGYGSCGAECVLWVGYSHTSGDFIHKCV